LRMDSHREGEVYKATDGLNKEKVRRAVRRSEADCGLHPLIHTLGSRKDSTTYGGRSEGAKVWIKVCNL